MYFWCARSWCPILPGLYYFQELRVGIRYFYTLPCDPLTRSRNHLGPVEMYHNIIDCYSLPINESMTREVKVDTGVAIVSSTGHIDEKKN